jgi:hypothetical protein
MLTGQGQRVREVPTQFEHGGLGLAEGRRDHYVYPGERFWHLQMAAPHALSAMLLQSRTEPGAQNRTHLACYHKLLELQQKTRLPLELQRIQRSLLRCKRAGMIVAIPGFVTNAASSVFTFVDTMYHSTN